MKRRYGYPSRVKDDQLEQLIAESIGNHPRFLGALIVIEVDQGYATLTGIVRSNAARQTADFLARVHGAVGVNNRLRLESDIGAPGV